MSQHRAEKTISVLLRAFMRGGLKHGEACECAVGNMLDKEPDWIFLMPSAGKKVYRTDWTEHGRELIAKSNYSLAEIIEIERAFEDRYNQRDIFVSNDPDSYKGLCAVFDLLCDDIDRDYFEARSPIVIRQESWEMVGNV